MLAQVCFPTYFHIDTFAKQSSFSARQALKAAVEAIRSECVFKSLTVDFEGLGAFRDQVLFAKPKEDETQNTRLLKIAGKR